MSEYKNSGDSPWVPEVVNPVVNPHLANIRSCFKCGWAEELGARLKAVDNENVCQKCRAARAAEEV